MAMNYTEEQLNSFDKATLFLRIKSSLVDGVHLTLIR